MSRTKFFTQSIILALFYLVSCDSGGDNSNSSPEPIPMPTPSPTQSPTIENEFNIINAFPNLIFANPLDIQIPADGTNRLFIIEQKEIINELSNIPNTQIKTISARNDSFVTFLNINNRVLDGAEPRLLCLAFHPDFANNGYFYVNYTAGNPLRSAVSRFNVSATNPSSTDPDSELILLEIPQPDTNHNEGQLAFGPQDSYLYILMGDGGLSGDESQDLTNLIATIIRIDVDNPQGQLNYGIPATNPFVNNSSGFRQEIYAYGFRNLWGIAFDVVSGRLWSGEVGQNSSEEINMIDNGGNYGGLLLKEHYALIFHQCVILQILSFKWLNMAEISEDLL